MRLVRKVTLAILALFMLAFMTLLVLVQGWFYGLIWLKEREEWKNASIVEEVEAAGFGLDGLTPPNEPLVLLQDTWAGQKERKRRNLSWVRTAIPSVHLRPLNSVFRKEVQNEKSYTI